MSVTSPHAAARRAPRTAAASVALALGAAALTGVGTVSVAETAQAAETAYTVRSGDGWWIIAQRTGVSMSTLQSLNGMTAATVLHPGMVLKTSGTATPAPAPAPSTSGSTYTVLAGDGWWIISYRTGVSASVLQSINGMTSSTTVSYTHLTLPTTPYV